MWDLNSPSAGSVSNILPALTVVVLLKWCVAFKNKCEQSAQIQREDKLFQIKIGRMSTGADYRISVNFKSWQVQNSKLK